MLRRRRFMNHQKITADSRPIKNEKSIQDSLEYLYEQNNNFINEISNINQLMDKNNNSVPNNSVSKGNSKPQFFMDGMNKQQQAVDSNFDTFLVDQALDSNQNNFGDLMESKIDTSSLSLSKLFKLYFKKFVFFYYLIKNRCNEPKHVSPKWQ